MTQHQISWGFRSLSFWLVSIISAGIIIVGIRYALSPGPSSTGFGLPLPEGKIALYGTIKGIRDIFSGLALAYLLYLKDRRITAMIFSLALIIPVTDCIVVFIANGWADWGRMLMHGGTALYMLVTSILLFNETQSQNK